MGIKLLMTKRNYASRQMMRFEERVGNESSAKCVEAFNKSIKQLEVLLFIAAFFIFMLLLIIGIILTCIHMRVRKLKSKSIRKPRESLVKRRRKSRPGNSE